MGTHQHNQPGATSPFPLGPYHPALPEPIWYQLQLAGETIRRVQITTSYCGRGVETLLTQRSYRDGLKLAERLCGRSAHHHRLAYCLALEQVMGVQAPPRARALRSLFCEIERLLSHLTWAVHLAQVAALPRPFYLALETREQLLEALDQSSGQRLLWGLPIPGGVTSEPEQATLAVALEQITPALERLEHQLLDKRGLQRQARGLAVLSAEQVQQLGLTGPLARAAGVDADERRSAPYDAYTDLDTSTPESSTAGDTQARLALRLGEMRASTQLARQVLAQLPDGPLAQPSPDTVPAGQAEISVEGPQGRETWHVSSTGTDRPAAVCITTASQHNLAAAPLLLEGQPLRAALLILASLDICVACVDK